MRRGVVLASLLVLAGSLVGCGSSQRDRVNDYVNAANDIQARAAPEFARANAAYERFAKDKLAKRAPGDLERAESAIRDTRAKLADLDPPAEARRLDRLLLRYFDLNIALAHETTLMSEYLPAATKATKPLKGINSRLESGLASGDVARQTKTLRRFHDDLGTVIAALRRLDPPPLLAALHSDQLTRLHSTRTLAEQLRRALLAGDQARVSSLLIRFRTVNTLTTTGITDEALLAYQERQQDVARAGQALQREQNRLAATLR